MLLSQSWYKRNVSLHVKADSYMEDRTLPNKETNYPNRNPKELLANRPAPQEGKAVRHQHCLWCGTLSGDVVWLWKEFFSRFSLVLDWSKLQSKRNVFTDSLTVFFFLINWWSCFDSLGSNFNPQFQCQFIRYTVSLQRVKQCVSSSKIKCVESGV